MTEPVPLKIRRLCWLVRGVGVLLLVSVFVLYLSTWAFPDLDVWKQHWARIASVGALPPRAAASFEGMDRFLVGAASVPYLACLAWAFFHLHRMLRGFERGAFFERSTVRHLRTFSGLLLLAKFLSLGAAHIRVAMYLPVAAPGTRVGFSLTGDDLALLLLCALFFLIAHLMDEGDRLAEENRAFL